MRFRHDSDMGRSGRCLGGDVNTRVALWARRRFTHSRTLFMALAVICLVIALTSVALDLMLLAARDGAPSTGVSPI